MILDAKTGCPFSTFIGASISHPADDDRPRRFGSCPQWRRPDIGVLQQALAAPPGQLCVELATAQLGTDGVIARCAAQRG